MPSLKSVKDRINSVKSTRKITTAMKEIAASKLRRAQVRASQARPYEDTMEKMVVEISNAMNKVEADDEHYTHDDIGHHLMYGRSEERNVHLIITLSSERGLCGGFNHNVVKETKTRVNTLIDQGKTVKILCIGKKVANILQRYYGDMIIDIVNDPPGGRNLEYAAVLDLSRRLQFMFEDGEFDVCTVIYNKFLSVISQKTTALQLIPVPLNYPLDEFEVENGLQEEDNDNTADDADEEPAYKFEYEPSEEHLLSELMTRNLTTQLFGAMLESEASKHGARMTAMDNATRNAKDMIDRLTLQYNRARQAQVTNELIEIISGAEAL